MRFLPAILFLMIWLPGFSQVAGDSLGKIKGVSLVSERFVLDSTHVKPIIELGADYAAVIPFSFMPHSDSGRVFFNHKAQWEGERSPGVRSAIRVLKRNNIQVMVKPQIWVGHGIYTGDIKMNSEEEWKRFESDYLAYVLEFAVLSEEEGADLFCIGTEMKTVVKQRPDYFYQLIREVRNVFSGKLTYAENWDCYGDVSFWGELDYIGVDAYFPICSSKSPRLNDLKAGWEPVVEALDSLATKYNRPIIFTELGYRSVADCAVEPWNYSGRDSKVDESAQYLALKAFFEVFWEEDFFQGVFLWKWHPDHDNAGGKKDAMFTFQNKEAESLVRSWFR